MGQVSISEFENEVLFNVLLGKISPKVTDERGDTPVVACLDSEPLSKLTDRVAASGGNATVFSRKPNGDVRVLAVIQSECALSEMATDLVTDPPSPDSSIGLFIDYVAAQEDGVELPSVLHSRVKAYGQAELTHA